MATAIALQAAPAGFRWIRSVSCLLRLACNLSGLARRSWFERLQARGGPAQRVELLAEDGQPMTVEVRGKGRPLLLVHGLGGSHHDWDDAVEHLARSHRVHTLDLRAHGARAGEDDAHATLEQMARDVALVIERLALDRPVLAGHSMGALVVMQYLAQHGAGRLSGVCLIDQSPRITVDAHWRLGLFGSLTATQLRTELAHLDRLVAALGRALRLGAVLRLLESLADVDFRQVIAGLSLPTLVVLGGASHHYGGLPLADYYRGALAQGKVTTYAASAHSPHREEPLRFAAELATFAREHCD